MLVLSPNSEKRNVLVQSLCSVQLSLSHYYLYQTCIQCTSSGTLRSGLMLFLSLVRLTTIFQMGCSITCCTRLFSSVHKPSTVCHWFCLVHNVVGRCLELSSLTSECSFWQDVKILYGSQTGTGQLFATKLGKKLKKKSIPAVVQNLGEYDETKAADENHLVLVVSCFGEGEPTHTTLKFWNWLMDPAREQEKEKFKKINYSVFGLGMIFFFVHNLILF